MASATRPNADVHARRWLVACAALTGVLSSTAQAKQPTLEIRPIRELRFGTFGVMTSGARVVSTTGAVTNFSIIPVPGGTTGPAEFTVVYDRGNESKHVLSLVIDVTLLGVQPVRQAGLTGTVSNFTSDLPGAATLTQGLPVRITINNCPTRLCSRTFKVGGRLQVERASGGGTLSIPLPFTADLIEVNGRKP